jgi:D-arabinose 1-dehydrogenase-like Zn-dependent alcohol dehydrogenase
MRAVVIDGNDNITLDSMPVPTPGPGEVLIKPGATGMCGTDQHLFSGHYAPGEYPLVPGHEFAGTIAGVGAGVTGLSEGDLVAAATAAMRSPDALKVQIA